MIKRLLADYPALRNKPFLRLVSGFAVSTIGSRFNLIAVNLLIYERTQNIGLIGAIWIVRTIARLLLQPYFGVIVDRFDRYKLIVISQILNAITAFCFVFVSEQTPILLFVLVFAFQALDGIMGPAMGSVMPQIVKEEELTSANSLGSLFDKTASTLGFAVGAILYTRLGADFLFVIDSLTYLVVLAAILPLRKIISRVVHQSKPNYWFNDALAGLKVITHYPAVLGVFIIVFTNSLVWRLFEVLIVPVASQTQFGEAGLGYIFSFLTIGGFIGAVFAPRATKILGEDRVWPMFLTFGLTAIPIAIFGVSNNGFIYLGAIIVSGILLDIVGIYTYTLIQKNIPNETLGRVFAFQNIAIALGGLPALLSLQPLTQAIGFQLPFIICAGIILAVVLVSGWLLRRVDISASQYSSEVRDAKL
jgi:MFS transporter, DHA3 family, macrolide efflux protein